MLNRHLYLAVAALVCISGTTGCEKEAVKIETEELKVPAFESVRLRGGFSVDISVGAEQKVTVTGAADELKKVTHEHELGRRLLLEAPRGVGEDATMQVSIVVPKLKAVYLGGELSASIRKLEQKAILLDVSGTSEVKISGTMDFLQVDCTGLSEIDASMLSAKRVEATTSGNCKMDVRVSDLLTADLSGKSEVGYFGSPSNVKKTGDDGGTVVHRGP